MSFYIFILKCKVNDGVKDAPSSYVLGGLLGREDLQKEQTMFLNRTDEEDKER